jgi:pimeloyl-ACP methyl ester carboxylesterase
VTAAAPLRLPALVLLLALAALLASCDGEGGAAPERTETPGGSAAEVWATPQTLPVTPVSVDYHVVNPQFSALPGARAIWGEYEGGGYRIEVPDDWNGEVVYFAHGYRGNPPELTVSNPPIREHIIERGYAWAASSYSRNGYEPGAGARDTHALREVIARELGEPAREYIYGQSMGGNVAALSLELYPDAYDGALSECGVVSGPEILDYFLSWGVLAGYLTGTDLYGATADAGAFGSRINGEVLPELGPLDDPTPAGEAFANAIRNLTGGPRPFFAEGFEENFIFNFVILVNAVALAGPSNAAAQNLDVEYELDSDLGIDVEALNSEVARIVPNPSYRHAEEHPEFSPMTGEIERPFLTVHNTGDLFVPISVEQSYLRAVEDAGNGDLLVQRAVRRGGHCNFTPAERTRAFDDLVRWVEDGVTPEGDDLSGDLMDVGLDFTEPLMPDDPGGTGR